MAKKMKITLWLSSFLLSGCIPSYTSIYHTPEVSGYVIELKSLQPIQDAIVKHNNFPESQTKTNSQGKYQLPAISSKEFKLLMPAHSLKNYLISLSHNGNEIIRIASATRLMRYIEKIDLGITIIDNQPQQIAKITNNNFIPYEQLKDYFIENALLASCDQNLAVASLAQLNISRKLYMHYQSQHSNSNHSPKLKDYLILTYQQTSQLWEHLEQTCSKTLQDYQLMNAIFEQVQDEASLQSTSSILN